MRHSVLRHCLTAMLLVGAAVSLGACGCRPGWVGPYGGVHGGRCWIG